MLEDSPLKAAPLALFGRDAELAACDQFLDTLVREPKCRSRRNPATSRLGITSSGHLGQGMRLGGNQSHLVAEGPP